MLEKPNGLAEFYGGVWGPDGGGLHHRGFGGMDRLCSVSPDPGEGTRSTKRGPTRRLEGQDRKPVLERKAGLIARLFGLDVRSSNAATESAMSAIEGTLDDMIDGFGYERR